MSGFLTFKGEIKMSTLAALVIFYMFSILSDLPIEKIDSDKFYYIYVPVTLTLVFLGLSATDVIVLLGKL